MSLIDETALTFPKLRKFQDIIFISPDRPRSQAPPIKKYLTT